MLALRWLGATLCLIAATTFAAAEESTVNEPDVLESVIVLGQRVANLQPAGSYASLATRLRYDPQIDLQARGLPEGQSDITVRGGVFENTGFRLGAVTIFDPQTGHYAVEIPVDPAMLTSPEVLTDVDNALHSFNASVATIRYGFREIETGGSVAVGMGQNRLRQAEARASLLTTNEGSRRFGAQFSAAASRGDGTLPNGDHDFKRFSGRLQWSGQDEESNVVFGFHDKFYGWPGAYTGFATLPETDHARVGLLVFDHRRRLTEGWWEVGAAYRWLDDDYDFDRRTVESGTPGSFEHETRSFSLGLMGEAHAAGLDWGFSGQMIADRLLRSTDLTYGDFNSRSYLSLSLVPRHDRALTGGRILSTRVGLRADLSNRDEDALAPLLSVSLEQPAGGGVSRFGVEFAGSSQLPGYTALNSAPNGLFGGNSTLGRSYADVLTFSAAFETAVRKVRAAVFWRRDDDLVDWTFRRGAPFARQANAVDLEVRGAELMAGWYGEKADLVLGYNWIDKDSDYGSAEVDASFYALNFARHRATMAMLLRPFPWFEIRFDGEYRRQQANPLRSGGDNAFIASASMSLRPVGAESVTVRVIADNLTDSEFQEFPGTPAVGRQVSLGLSLDW